MDRKVSVSFERLFVQKITEMGWSKALSAYQLVKREMCKENGYTRHDGSDYYLHCVAVALTLINLGVRDEDTITAALLHDLVEDVPNYTIGIIRELFGERVAKIVDLVTKKPDVDYKVAENLIAYLAAISKDWRASLVKTADRMHNFSTLGDCTLEKKLKQTKETEEHYFSFFKTCRKNFPQYAHIFAEAKIQIKPHLDEIKLHYAELAKVQAELEVTKAQLENALKELAELKSNIM